MSQFAQLTQSYPSPLIPLSFKQKAIAAIKQNSLVKQLYLSLADWLNSDKSIIEPLAGNGYNYEAREVINCLQNGQLESEIMPLDETLKIMQAVDCIRAQG